MLGPPTACFPRRRALAPGLLQLSPAQPDGGARAPAGAGRAGRRCRRALEALADALGAPPWQAPALLLLPEAPQGAHRGPGGRRADARCRPTPSVSVEGGTCGYPFSPRRRPRRCHGALTNTGGAILPEACRWHWARRWPRSQRRAVALVSDGSTQFYGADAVVHGARAGRRRPVLVAVTTSTASCARTASRRQRSKRAQSEALTALDRPHRLRCASPLKPTACRARRRQRRGAVRGLELPAPASPQSR